MDVAHAVVVAQRLHLVVPGAGLDKQIYLLLGNAALIATILHPLVEQKAVDGLGIDLRTTPIAPQIEDQMGHPLILQFLKSIFQKVAIHSMPGIYQIDELAKCKGLTHLNVSDTHITEADFILCRHTLEHIGDVRRFMEDIRTLVGARTDTGLFFETPDWATELRERHRLAVDILRLAGELGVEFAFGQTDDPFPFEHVSQ